MLEAEVLLNLFRVAQQRCLLYILIVSYVYQRYDTQMGIKDFIYFRETINKDNKELFFCREIGFLTEIITF